MKFIRKYYEYLKFWSNELLEKTIFFPDDEVVNSYARTGLEYGIQKIKIDKIHLDEIIFYSGIRLKIYPYGSFGYFAWCSYGIVYSESGCMKYQWDHKRPTLLLRWRLLKAIQNFQYDPKMTYRKKMLNEILN